MLKDKFTLIGIVRVDLSKIDAYKFCSDTSTVVWVNGQEILLPIQVQDLENKLSEKSEYEESLELHSQAFFKTRHISEELESIKQSIDSRKEFSQYNSFIEKYNQIILDFFKCYDFKGSIFYENTENIKKRVSDFKQEIYSTPFNNQ